MKERDERGTVLEEATPERAGEPLVRPGPAELLERQMGPPPPPLGLGARIVLLIFGWVLILLGIVQLLIPGPGVLTILMGAAVLSLVSQTIHDLLRRLFTRWPRAWKYLLAFRRRVHGWFHRPKTPSP